MTDIDRLHRDLIARAVDGDGKAPGELRRAAFELAGLGEPVRTLLEKVAHHAYRVTDQDVAAVRDAGFSEDQVFELVVCAAIGQATRQYESGLRALQAAEGD